MNTGVYYRIMSLVYNDRNPYVNVTKWHGQVEHETARVYFMRSDKSWLGWACGNNATDISDMATQFDCYLPGNTGD